MKFLHWVADVFDQQEPLAYDWMQLGTLRFGAVIGMSADNPSVVDAGAVIRLGLVEGDAEGPTQSLVMPLPYSSFCFQLCLIDGAAYHNRRCNVIQCI